jgi:GTP cyclohydrolase I
MRTIKWEEIFNKINIIKNKYNKDTKYWGIPRGGQVVAGMLGNAVDNIEECDVIVDDLIDSGNTIEKYKKYDKPIEVLFDKRIELQNEWLVFPWENHNGDIEENVVRLLQYFGEDVEREGLIDTPKRYIKFFKEFLNPPQWNCTTFEGEGYDEMIIQKNIPFYSLCEHHIAPFFGKGHIAYIPNKKIVGLSKLARTLESFSRRLQNQERITQQVAEFLNDKLKPKGVAVILSAQHMCMEMRGVKKHDTFTTTSKMLGVFTTKYEARMELMNLIKNE